MNVRKIVVCISILFAAIGCRRALTHHDVEVELMKAMTRHLYQRIHYDSARTKFDVQTVVFFEDKTFYDCEFKVKMTEHGRDTTGYMTATVSKDFATVTRKL